MADSGVELTIEVVVPDDANEEEILEAIPYPCAISGRGLNARPMITIVHGTHGTNLPKVFVEIFRSTIATRDADFEESLDILAAGPDHERYREAWREVLNNAVLVSRSGSKSRLVMGTDLFAVHSLAEWSEQDGAYVFAFPDRDTAE